MASSATAFAPLATLLLLLVLLQPPVSSADDLLSTIFGPLMGNVCEKVECGRGKCKPLTNVTIGIPYECECDSGWKQTRPQNVDGLTFLNFLPCIIPNCSMDVSCNKPAEPPVQDKAGENTTFPDPCSWADCGGGLCNKTSLITYNCICSEGYSNLLNSSIFPCYKECAIGMNCKDLGIGVQGPPAPTPVLAQNDGARNQAGSPIGRGLFSWPLALMLSLVVIVQLR